MTEDATLPGPRRQAARVDLQMPLTQEGLRASLRQAFSWIRPFADSPSDVQVFGDGSVNAGIGTLLRPIATPLSFGGFDPGVIDPVVVRVPRSGLRARSWPARRSSRCRSPVERLDDAAGAAARRSDRRRRS